jgi:hypothetical protein
MNALAADQTYMIAKRFDKAVKLIRRALAETELSLVGEFDTTGTFGNERGRMAEPSRILLVDCPLLAFEAQALDRAAEVFFPMHVLFWADGDQTRASTANPAALFDVRLPSGAAIPMARLQARISMALESVSSPAGASHNEQEGKE